VTVGQLARLTLSDAVFISNRVLVAAADGGGGAIFVHEESSARVSGRSEFVANSVPATTAGAGFGGGVCLYLFSSLTVDGPALFLRNAARSGGAVYAYGACRVTFSGEAREEGNAGLGARPELDGVCPGEGMPIPNFYDLRLADCDLHCCCRLELFVGEWGTICHDSFTDDSAKVACRQMGLPTAAATGRPFFWELAPRIGRGTWQDMARQTGVRWQ